VSPHLRALLLAHVAELSPEPEEAARAAEESCELAAGVANPWTQARALAALGSHAHGTGDAAKAASSLRQAAGLLMSAGRWDPLLLDVLRRGAGAMEGADPEAAAAARRRADDLARELEARGYAGLGGPGGPGGSPRVPVRAGPASRHGA
jgi:hypothetical protein